MNFQDILGNHYQFHCAYFNLAVIANFQDVHNYLYADFP